MTLPKPTVKTIVATFERAQQREGIDEYTMRMVLAMNRENPHLMGAIMTLLDGFVKLEELDDQLAVRCMTCMSLMYDCMKTQLESDELNEMFGEPHMDYRDDLSEDERKIMKDLGLEDEENASS